MDAFATVDDYAARYGEYDDADALAVILLDASRLIAAELDAAGKSEWYVEPSDEYAERLAQVACSIARKAVGMDDDFVPYGASQASQGAGAYTAQFTLSNPYGSLFLEKSDRVLLGIQRRTLAGFAAPSGGRSQCR